MVKVEEVLLTKEKQFVLSNDLIQEISHWEDKLRTKEDEK